MYHSAFGLQINNYMITETSKLNATTFTVSLEPKINPSIIKSLIQKIKQKQKEPFAKIFVNLHPAYFSVFISALKINDLNVKNMATDNKTIMVEI